MYFRTPFATGGDRTAIPNDTQPDGSISYTDGYGPDYQLNPGTDPSALDIEREKMNEIFYELSLAMQRVQQFWAPDWISAAVNGGVAYSYPAGAIVLYTDATVYQSLVNANTATPGTDLTKWIPFLSNLATVAALNVEVARAEAAEAVLAAAIAAETARAEAAEALIAQPGDIKARASANVYAGWLSCDGASYLRATYPALFADIGVIYGAVDGDHFNVPNFNGNGAFLRGAGGNAAAIGTLQATANLAHSHLAGVAQNQTEPDVYGHTATDLPGAATEVVQKQNAGIVAQPITSTDGAVEARPINFAVTWVIKT